METLSSELIVALSALPRAEEAPVPPPQSLNKLMDHTLKNYQEECVDEGTWQPDPATEVGEWEQYDLNEMDAKMNMLYQASPFHPHHFIHCLNPQTEIGSLRYKCPQESCPVYLFEDTRDIRLQKLKEDTDPQVRAKLQWGSLKCKCGWTPKMKLSRTSKNSNKVFTCGEYFSGQQPSGYFQWLHGPLWCPRDQAQPLLSRWVKKPVPSRDNTGSTPMWKTGESSTPFMSQQRWVNQFAESAEAQRNQRHLFSTL